MASPPRYEKLARQLIDDITSGTYKPGDRFFSQTELMQTHSLSYATVVRALKELEQSGYLVRIQGSGTFIKCTEHSPVAAHLPPRLVHVYMPWNSPSSASLDYSLLYRALQSQCPSSVRLQVVPCSMNPYEMETILQTDDQPSALMFVYPEAVHLPVINRFARHLPTVAIGLDLPGSAVSSVAVDYTSAAEHAVRHLLDQGHADIGLLSEPRTSASVATFLDAIHSALQRSGFPAGHTQEYETHPVHPGPYEVAIRLLNSAPQLTAVIATSGQIVRAVYAAAIKHGRTIPADLSVIGLGDSAIVEDHSPAVTAIELPYHDLAAQAIQILASLLQGDKNRHVYVQAQFHTRDSVSSPSPFQAV